MATRLAAENLPRPPALPNSAEKFLALRKMRAKRSLNDLVEDCHLALADDDKYIGYLWALWDSQAIEGSVTIDRIKAAEMIRDYATKHAIASVDTAKLDSIVKSLGVVLRRYELSTQQRRDKVSGERVAA